VWRRRTYSHAKKATWEDMSNGLGEVKMLELNVGRCQNTWRMGNRTCQKESKGGRERTMRPEM